MLSPFFAFFFSSAKMSSCLRMRLAFSMLSASAISRSWLTCNCLSSDKFMAYGGAVFYTSGELPAAEIQGAEGVGVRQNTGRGKASGT